METISTLESISAFPAVLFSDETLMRPARFNIQLVPAKADTTVTASARAHAAPGEDIIIYHWVHTLSYVQGPAAQTEWPHTEAVHYRTDHL